MRVGVDGVGVYGGSEEALHGHRLLLHGHAGHPQHEGGVHRPGHERGVRHLADPVVLQGGLRDRQHGREDLSKHHNLFTCH